jgi:hypothetical protein
MSCYNSNCYLPEPPRAWSRVQNNCSLIIDDSSSGLVKLPYSNKIIPVASLGQELAMLNKGNVLQYKANSSNLTKAQRYSKIAQGQWVNRNTTWATQSTSGFTNPNTTSLKRSGNVVNIAIDPITGAILGPTTAPVTCPQSVPTNNGGLPSNGGGGSDIDDPNIPPPVEPTPGSNTFPVIIPDTPVEPIVIQDGGILICSVQENVCTGETKSSLSQQLCNPTSDSDVPGTIQELCWNDGTPTWYPRSRYIMTNSANKWPVNATLVSAIRSLPPVITSITNNCTIVTLTWTQDETCLPVSRFDIYQDGVFVKSVAGTVFTTEVDINNANNSTYNFFIIAGTSGNVVSNPSNSVSISISIVVYPPTNLINGTPKLTSITSITEGLASVQISWSPSLLNLCGITGYNIYQNNILVATVPPSVTSYTTTLPTNAIYNFNVTSVLGEIESVFSSTLNVNLPEIYTTTGSPADTFLAGSITLKYSVAGAFDFNYELSMEYTLVGGGSGGGYWYDIVGTAAGGGGQVLNTNGSRNVSANNWAIVVGTGGVGATTGADGGTGTDSSILGTGFSVATNNNSYAGQGGQGAVNFSYAGGGGSGNPTSANGGIYNTTNRNGTGGGGGSLTLVDLTNTIITLDTIGGPGQDSPSTTGGNGGNGQPGIDLITYGGGGGGGGWPGPIPYSPDFDGNPGGIGGAGGGGTGATNVTIPLSRDGTAPGGGGGGGLNTSNTFPGFGIDPGSGSNGIVILLFTAPP